MSIPRALRALDALPPSVSIDLSNKIQLDVEIPAHVPAEAEVAVPAEVATAKTLHDVSVP